MPTFDERRCLAQLDSCRQRIAQLVRSTHDAEDVYQDVYIVAAHGSTSRDWSRPQTGWLRIVTRNIAVRRYRHSAVRQCQSLEIDPESRQSNDPIAELCRTETQMIVQTAMQSLKPKYREVIKRRFFSDEPLSHIAGDLGIPEQTVRTRYKRGMKQLKLSPQIASLA